MSTTWKTEAVDTNFRIDNPVVSKIADETRQEVMNASYGDDNIVGISKKQLDRTIEKISLISDKVNLLFDDLESIFNGVNYFNCSASNILNNKMNDISINVPTVKKNIASYIKDLNLVSSNYNTVTLSGVAIYEKAGSKVPEIKPYNKAKEE